MYSSHTPTILGSVFCSYMHENRPSLTSFTCCCHKRRISTHAVCCHTCIVSSSFDGLLYAEPGVCKFRHRVITLLSGVIRKITAHQFCSRASSRSQGSHSHQGGVTSALGVNDRGVTHAGESFTPLTPVLSSTGRGIGTYAGAVQG